MSEDERYPIVELNGKRLILFNDALVDCEHKDKHSYAHIMSDGTIKSFRKVIGHRDDLVDTGETDTMSFADTLGGILEMLGGLY